jgi:hypothetical protein
MKINKLIPILIMTLLFVGFASATITFTPSDKFIGWRIEITGNESILYNLYSLTHTQICITPKQTDLSDVIITEDDLTKPILEKAEELIIEEQLEGTLMKR